MKTLINFIWFIYHWTQFKDMRKTTSKEKTKRINTCESCPNLNRKGLLTKLKGNRCGICGCFVYYKANYIWEVCPDNPPRWEEIKQDNK